MRLLHGDCLDLLPTLAESSVDACVTDPPYGLEFMGKEWDGQVPGVAYWLAVLRVLRPGAYLLAFGGTRTEHRLACAIEDAGFRIQDKLMWLYGQGFPKGKTQLKPAYEPILLAYKPGKRTLNVDECRIPASGESLAGGLSDSHTAGWHRPWTDNSEAVGRKQARKESAVARAEALGRWPANVVLDEEAAALLDEQSGVLQDGVAGKRGGVAHVTLHGLKPYDEPWGGYGGQGGASRFFYTAKADSGERHYAGRNNHPTVKPVDLMRWLCRLVTPKGGTVLDPFMGSGSTGIAALAEGFDFIGIEREAEWVDQSKRRIKGPLFAVASS